MAAIIPPIFANIPVAGGHVAPETAPFYYSNSAMVFCERNGYPKDRGSIEAWCMAYYLNHNTANPMIDCQINQGVAAAAAPAAMPNPTTLALAPPLVWGAGFVQERNIHGVLALIANPPAGAPFPAPAVADHNLTQEIREFIRDYRDSRACATAAVALIACNQTKPLRGRNFRSFKTIFNLDTTNEMMILVAKAFRTRFALVAADANFAAIRAITPFILYHTKAYSSAGVVLKAFEALHYIGVVMPLRPAPPGPLPAWFPPLAPGVAGMEIRAYYRALDSVSHTIENQLHVLDRDVVTAIAVNEVFGQPLDDWKHGEKVLNATPIAMYNTVKAVIRAALAETTAARTAALAAGGGAALAATNNIVA